MVKACCPPGEGCNGPPGHEETCALWRCRRSDEPEAVRALTLWERFVAARDEHRSRAQRRFLRRAYIRARDQAVPPWTPTAT